MGRSFGVYGGGRVDETARPQEKEQTMTKMGGPSRGLFERQRMVTSRGRRLPTGLEWCSNT